MKYSKAQDKWVVITSIAYPTPAVTRLASLPGWKVVVVADKKTPQDWASPGVDFLSVQQQDNLDYKTSRLVPWNSYGYEQITRTNSLAQILKSDTLPPSTAMGRQKYHCKTYCFSHFTQMMHIPAVPSGLESHFRIMPLCPTAFLCNPMYTNLCRLAKQNIDVSGGLLIAQLFVCGQDSNDCQFGFWTSKLCQAMPCAGL
jgi:hypothetical protein